MLCANLKNFFAKKCRFLKILTVSDIYFVVLKKNSIFAVLNIRLVYCFEQL